MHHAERGPGGPAPAVRVPERLATLGGDERRDQRRRWRGRALEARAEVAALDALHREEHLGPGAPEVEHRHDVLVGERHRQPRLAHEQIEEARIARALGADALDHQHLLDAGRPAPRDEDLGHAAARERAQQLVPAQRARHARAP